MQRKIDIKSVILGAALAATVMLSVAAESPKGSSPAAGTNGVERVNGIGGVFFKARDPEGNRIELWEPKAK